jgi:hypothetical protein
VTQVGEEGFVPIISEMPGFVAHYLVDAGDGSTARLMGRGGSKKVLFALLYAGLRTPLWSVLGLFRQSRKRNSRKFTCTVADRAARVRSDLTTPNTNIISFGGCAW